MQCLISKQIELIHCKPLKAQSPRCMPCLRDAPLNLAVSFGWLTAAALYLRWWRSEQAIGRAALWSMLGPKRLVPSSLTFELLAVNDKQYDQ